MRFYENNTKTV